MTEQSAKKRIDLKTTQVAAGSMASVTSAVAASQLGVAGTLVGAGVGSVLGTVAGAVYEHYLDRTHEQVRTLVPRRIVMGTSPPGEATPTTLVAVEAATDELDTQTAVETAVVETPAVEAPPAIEMAAAVERSQPTWSWLRSRRGALALSAAAGLGIALAALTGFEAFTGQPVGASSDGSGTSVGRVFGGGTAAEPTSTPSPDTATGEPTSTPTPTPTEAIPSTTTTSPAPTSEPSTPSTSPTTEPVPQPTQLD
jgi:hypothetical protein